MHFNHDWSKPQEVADAIAAHVNTSMWAQTEHNSVIHQLTVTPLDGSSASLVVPTDLSTKWQGAGSPAEIVPQVAALIKFTTALRGRSHRGRVFLPWCCETTLADGKLLTSTRDVLNTNWLTFIQGMQTALITPVVASYKLATAAAVMSHQAELVTATQRRRNIR